MSSRFRTLLHGAVLPLLYACAGGDAAPRTDAVIDTLANGAVHVSNGALGAWMVADAEPWRLEEEVRVGRFEGQGPYVFGQIRAIVPNDDGSFWVLDSQASELRLFDADGAFARAVGRRGDGPGEFALNPCAFRALNGEIWVEDVRRRWQRFDSAGELLGQLSSPSNLGCGVRVLTVDDRFFAVNVESFAPPPAPSQSYFVGYSLDPAGELVALDTFPPPVLPPSPTVTWVSADGRAHIVSTPPLVHRASWVLGVRGAFLVTPGGGRYLIQRQSLEGDTLLVIERQHEPVTVPDSIRDASIREFQREGFTAADGFDPRTVARVYPPFEQILEGADGTLWVRRQLDGGTMGLDVFSPEGLFLGPAVVPPDFARMTVFHITAQHLYGTVRDELDVPYVVRLGIRKP